MNFLQYKPNEPLQKLRDVIFSYFISHPNEALNYQQELNFLRNASEFYHYVLPYQSIFLNQVASIKEGIHWDEKNSKFYVEWFGHHMYLPFKSVEQCESYMWSILFEQGIGSPHNYKSLLGNIDERILIDCGAAEGFLALMDIDHLDKIYLIESNKTWIDCLRLSYRGYSDKVVFINSFLGNPEVDGNTSLDNLFNFNDEDWSKTLIKMDIEGYEVPCLRHSPIACEKANRIIACTYHKMDDKLELSGIASQYDRASCFSQGYMLFPYDTLTPPFFRKGLILIK